MVLASRLATWVSAFTELRTYRRSGSEEVVTGPRLRHRSRRQSLPEAGARRIDFEESALLWELQLEVS